MTTNYKIIEKVWKTGLLLLQPLGGHHQTIDFSATAADWGMKFNASKCYILSIITKTPKVL